MINPVKKEKKKNCTVMLSITSLVLPEFWISRRDTETTVADFKNIQHYSIVFDGIHNVCNIWVLNVRRIPGVIEIDFRNDMKPVTSHLFALSTIKRRSDIAGERIAEWTA